MSQLSTTPWWEIVKKMVKFFLEVNSNGMRDDGHNLKQGKNPE